MLIKRLRPQKILGLLLLVITLGVSSCEKENDLTPNSNASSNSTSNPPEDTIPTAPAIGKLTLLVDQWELYETFKNNQQQTSNGTDSYEYTKDGQFMFESANGWSTIGNYAFFADSSAINMVFVGTSNAIKMNLEVLDQNELHTRFTTNGNEYLYKYRK